MDPTDGTEKSGTELYLQDGVVLITINPYDVDLCNSAGTLSVTNYDVLATKFIEWRQCEYHTLESPDQDWEVIEQAKRPRSRTTSGCVTGVRSPNVQIKLNDLASCQLSSNHKEISFCTNNRSARFKFERGNAKEFLNYLRNHLHISENPKKRNFFYVRDQQEVANLSKSFSELQLSTDDPVWSLFRNRPYETAMAAFSKVTEVFLYKPIDDEREDVESLHRSLQDNDMTADEYEVVAEKVTLPKVTAPPRIFPLTVDQWANFFTPDGSILEEKIVRELIFHGGVHPSIRPQVWMFLLGYYPWQSTYAERDALRRSKNDEYFRMKLQWKTMSKEQEDRFSDFKERKSLIEKDVARTDRVLPIYAENNSPSLQKLQDILMTYVMYNFDLGYVQGMSDILSPLLSIMPNEVDAFWCFTSIIDRMVKNFDIDQAGMKVQLQQIYVLLNIVEPELAAYLHRQESSNMFFCFRWLLVWFKREFTYDDIFVLWEALWAETCLNYHLLICVAILVTEKDNLMTNEYGFTEILKHINELSNKIDVQETLRKAEGIYLQLKEADDLPNAVRSIMGFELKPEPEISTQCEEINSTNTTAVNSNPYVDNEAVENGFENSLSMFL